MSWLLLLLQTLTSPVSAPPLDLATLEAQALARHPAVRRASAEVDAARGRAKQAGAWSNPIVGGSLGEWRPRETPSGVYGGFVEQMIPLGGKLAAASAAGQADVALADSHLSAAQQRVVAAVREHYYHVVVAEERLAVSTRLRTLAVQSARTAQQLFNVGIADRPDVLNAEAEAAHARAEVVAAQAARDAAWRQLGAAVAEPSLAPRALAVGIADALPVLNRDEAFAQVVSENGAMAMATRSAALARASVKVEQTATRPDVFIRADAGSNRESSNGRAIGPQLGIEAGVSIPLFNRNRGGIGAATSAVIGADAAVDELRLDLESRFADVFAQYEGARARVSAYRTDILPRAEQAYELQQAKYQEMVAPYLGVLQAQRVLFQMHEQYLDAIDRAWMAVSALRSALAGR